jgi:hypothetical protein
MNGPANNPGNPYSAAVIPKTLGLASKLNERRENIIVKSTQIEIELKVLPKKKTDTRGSRTEK